MKLILASKNKGKLREMTELLEHLGVEIVLQSEMNIDVDVEETGATFKENAFLKADAVCRASGIAAIADDSGIMVDALDGRPGVYSARYGGEGCKDDVSRYELMLSEMENVPDDLRSARYVCAIVCVFPDGKTLSTEATCEGSIARAPIGDGGFGYDPIFIVEGSNLTMAQLTEEHKNQISHRGKAIRAFGELIKER